MDFFAHIAWAYIIFNKLKKREFCLALLFAALPDIIGWGGFMFYNLFNGRFGQPDLTKIPSWTWMLYDISHSLVVFGVILLVVWLIYKKIPLFMLAYPIEILMDIPTHSREFLPTPFLWPVSNWHFPGFSWGQGWFMILNWSLILGGIVYVSRERIRGLWRAKRSR
ncbi:hypothetical protein COV19_05910 [Candidatus Woesearchaeota archaeon CG10_big_fil_rev_8_21_14_0_10_44_13]|nr:MAG: hypothetical protein COV19_05910 [Candidatus Woesearchaeota archaeon CG10_big_fil_rev_8_21_14_0_10_44_13]